MDNAARELARSAIEDWDFILFDSVRLPCVFSKEYQETLDVSGYLPTATVLRSDVEGDEKRVTITKGSTEVNIRTVAGEELGPFVIEDSRPEMPFYQVMILRAV